MDVEYPDRIGSFRYIDILEDGIVAVRIRGYGFLVDDRVFGKDDDAEVGVTPEILFLIVRVKVVGKPESFYIVADVSVFLFRLRLRPPFP